jgi:hypothetical protein
MAPIKAGKGSIKARCAWEPPVVTALAIGAETKSARQNQESPGFAEPQPPTPPATKLGFSFEMSMPLAARTDR